MGRIGVQMIHRPCGHSGYHVVEDPGKDARTVYDKMAEKPCPLCSGEVAEEVQPMPKSKVEAILNEIEKVVLGKKKVPKHRQVTIRRGRR